MASLSDYDDSEHTDEQLPNAAAAGGLLESSRYLSLAMVNDRKTEMYVKFAKVMILFQSDRKNIMNTLTHLGKKFKTSACIVSDSTYMKETNGIFNPRKTDVYYKYFRRKVKEGCESGSNLIVIAPSMTYLSQNEYYLYLAQRTQYVVLVVPPLITQQRDSDNGQAKSFSQFDISMKCPNNFQHLFCAWFLHDKDSIELRNEAELYIRDCFKNIRDFRNYFSKICSIEDVSMHYNMHHKRQDLAYCMTAMFNSNIDTQSYFMESSVEKFYGKMAKLYIVGFIVSPHMIAARVKLTQEQKELWKLPNDLNESCTVTSYPSELLAESKVKKDVEVALISSKCNRTLTYTRQTTHDPTNSILPYFKGRSCHIVLGRVTDAPIRNVDYDVQFAVHRETKAVKSDADLEVDDVGRSVVRRIGKYWFVYLKETLCVEGFFASCIKAKKFDISRF